MDRPQGVGEPMIATTRHGRRCMQPCQHTRWAQGATSTPTTLRLQQAGQLALAPDTWRFWRCVRLALWTHCRPPVSLPNGSTIIAKVCVRTILPRYLIAHIAQRRPLMTSGTLPCWHSVGYGVLRRATGRRWSVPLVGPVLKSGRP